MAERLSRHVGPKTAMFLAAINEIRIDLVANRIDTLNARYTRIKDKKAHFVTFPEEEVGPNRRLERLDAATVRLYKKRSGLIEKHRRLYNNVK